MKKYPVFFIGLFLFVLIGAYFITNSRKQNIPLGLSGKMENGVRIVEVKASKYKFDPDPIVVKLSERVRLVVTSIGVDHGLGISSFNVNVAVPAGKTETVEFTADKKGTFHMHCSVYCGPGHGNMHGEFIVR